MADLMDALTNTSDPFLEGQAAAARTQQQQIANANAYRQAQADISLDAYNRSQTPTWSTPQSPLGTVGGATSSAAPTEVGQADRIANATAGAPPQVGIADAQAGAAPQGQTMPFQQSAPPAPAPAPSPSPTLSGPSMTSAPNTGATGAVAQSPLATAGGPPSSPATSAAGPDAALPYGPAALSTSRQAYIRGLQNVPGGGSLAAQMHWADLSAQTDVMHQVFERAQTDPEGAMRFAEMAGMPVTPQVQQLLGNRAAVAQMHGVFDDAKQLYPNEIDAPKKWQYISGRMQALQQQPGNPTAGNPNTAPVGEAPTSKPFYEPQGLTSIGPDGKPQIAVFDPNKATTNPTGSVTQTGVEGFGRYGGANRTFWTQGTPQERLLNMWLAQPGHENDLAGAQQFVAGARTMQPAQMDVAAHNAAARDVQLKYAGSSTPPPPDQQQAEIQALTAQYYQQMQALAAAPRQQPTPAPAVQPGTPTAAPPNSPAPSAAAPPNAAPTSADVPGAQSAPIVPSRDANGKLDPSQLQPGQVYATKMGPAKYLGNGQFQQMH